METFSEKQPNKGGRPTILTKKLGEEIIAAAARGNFLESASVLSGTSADVVRRWIRRGFKEKQGIYFWFAVEIKKAYAKAEDDAVQFIRRDGTWVSKAWFLERRFPERWARRNPPDPKEKPPQQPKIEQVCEEIDEELGTKNHVSS